MPDEQPVPARDLEDRTLIEASVGWHLHHGHRSAVLLFLRLSGLDWLEAQTAGNGSVLFRRRDPEPFDMAEHGSFVMTPVDETHPLASLLGRTIGSARSIVWRQTTIGVELAAESDTALIVIDFDEIFVSTSDLPADFAEGSVVVDT